MISVDTPEDNKKFAEMHGADYPILSDVTKEIANKYGVLAAAGTALRTPPRLPAGLSDLQGRCGPIVL